MPSPKPKKQAQTCSVIGLGKLGAPLAACLAHKGYDVIGVDSNKRAVQSVNEGRSPVFEPGLEEMIRANQKRITATGSCHEAVLGSEITFIIVPTPSDAHGGFSLRYVQSTCEQIGNALRKKRDYHLVVLTSTVSPGSTDNTVRPVLETHSGKRCGQAFGLCYSPEFVALGSVIRDMFNPDLVLIGESDSRSGDALESVYQRLCECKPAVARMNFVNAELTKLAVNTYVTTKISFANMVARICEQLPGANVDVVTSALGLDSRIGRKYLNGAIGYGGPCFPRDNIALSTLARRIGAPARLAEATDEANRQQVSYLAQLVKSKRRSDSVVGILGLAYKPNTDVVEESQGLLLAQALSADGIPVVAYDPAAIENARKAFKGAVALSESVEECVRRSDVIVITTPWEEFRHIPLHVLERHSAPRVLVDCWRFLNAEPYRRVSDYIPLGVGEDLTANKNHNDTGKK